MSYQMPVERGKIREFAKATHAQNPAYVADEPVIPPTFLTTARLVWEPEDQGPAHEVDLDLQRLLHGEEEYVFYGPPPRAGQTLTVTVSPPERSAKEGRRGGSMRLTTMTTEFRDESGILVATQVTTLIETSRPPMGQLAEESK
jgi:N-terminal half of MaoC dehydratase